MHSSSIKTSSVEIPLYIGHESMIQFDISTLEGLPKQFKKLVTCMKENIPNLNGTSFFTIHGKKLNTGDTLRRGGKHTDGNYEKYYMNFNGDGGGGWKVGENGPKVGSKTHDRQYIKSTGGIILASNYESCLGWNGKFSGNPNIGGDCEHINVRNPFLLEANSVYYGNNHFIHESMPVSTNVHRVFVRITLNENHVYGY